MAVGTLGVQWDGGGVDEEGEEEVLAVVDIQGESPCRVRGQD